MSAFDEGLPKNLWAENSKERTIMDKVVKAAIYKAVNIIADRCKPLYNERKKNGWLNPEVGVLDSHFEEIIEDEEAIAWKHPLNDGRHRSLYRGIQMIATTILDQDSFYLRRFFRFIGLVNRDYEKYRIQYHVERTDLMYEVIKAALLEGATGQDIDKALKKLKEERFNFERLPPPNDKSKRIQDVSSEPSGPAGSSG